MNLYDRLKCYFPNGSHVNYRHRLFQRVLYAYNEA